MKFFAILGFGILLLLFFSDLTYGSKICYEAKTCIHNGNERCGINSKGEPRRFLDSCDIKEFNCLKGTDYQKTSIEKCSSLPPIPPEEENKKKPH